MQANSIISMFITYFGDWKWLLIYATFLTLFIILTEKNKRFFWVVFVAVLIATVYNKFGMKIINRLSNETSEAIYYRFLWIVPWLIIVCATMIIAADKIACLLFKREKEHSTIMIILGLGVGAFCIIMFIKGNSIYSTLDGTWPENIYYSSDEMVDIARIIEQDSENDIIKYMAFGEPYESLQVISSRLKPSLHRAYGIEMFLSRSTSTDDYTNFSKLIAYGDQVNISAINLFLKNKQFDYIICRTDLNVLDIFEKLDFMLLDCTENYSVFKNNRQTEWIYDDKGELTSVRYYDSSGDAVFKDNGYVGINYEYNSKGQVKRITYVDESGNAVKISDGYASKEYIYDGHIYNIGEKYYDELGELTDIAGGYCGIIKTVDRKQRETSITYIDNEEKPKKIDLGYSSVKKEYDKNNNVTSLSYYDENGQEILLADDYFCIERKYSDDGKIEKETFYVDKKTLGRKKDSYSSIIYNYDENGNIIEKKFLNNLEENVNNNDGVSTIKYYYFENKFLSEIVKFDDNNKLISDEIISDYSLILYLEEQKNRDMTIYISVKDEASQALDNDARKKLSQMGFDKLAKIQNRESYVGVVTGENIVYERIGTKNEKVSFEEENLSIISAGYDGGNVSSILIAGEEYSNNKRGINIVVVDKNMEVIESKTFDTYLYPVYVP